MNKKRIEHIIGSVIVTTLVLTTTLTVSAKVAKVEIPVFFNDIKIWVNGEELETEKEPFIYEGTTYLPVRDVGEAVNKGVNWNNDIKSVLIYDEYEEYIAPVITKKEVVEGKVKLYDTGNYHENDFYLAGETDRIIGTTYFPADTIDIRVSNITTTSFDYEILLVNKSNESIRSLAEVETAYFVEDGTVAQSYTDSYNLRFTFPNGFEALPNAIEMEIEGLEALDGKLFSNNNVPGYEFN